MYNPFLYLPFNDRNNVLLRKVISAWQFHLAECDYVTLKSLTT